MKKILLLLCALFLSQGALLSSVVYASGSRGIPQDNLSKPSKAYDVGMLFYKMIHSTPTFSTWIDASPAYKAMEVARQDEFKNNEMLRLQQAFAALDVKKAAIIIRTTIKAEVVTTPGSPEKPRKNVLKLDLPPSGSLFFPYTVGDQSIAVIPNGVDLYREIPITDAEAKAISVRMPPNAKVTLVLEIAPTMADGKQPMMMADAPYWLLIGEIGFLGLYNNSADVMWSYHAPSYVMQGQDTLLELRSNHPVPSKLPTLAPTPSVPLKTK